MPEIAEIARITHFLRLHLVGKKIAKIAAVDDQIVYGKVGTTGAAFEEATKGRTVVSAGSQGKYFWLTLDKPPHPVMHFGMTGWIHIKGEKTSYASYYNKQKPEDVDQWPPRFWKFHLETAGKNKVELAFTDPRRLGRIRLVDCPGAEIRNKTPLVENGPDPVVDLDIFTLEFLSKMMRRKRVPIKSLLLDQANISGIGNWVGDEVLYQAKLHPEQYCNEFDDGQVKALYAAITHVCQKSCDLLGDSDQFPEDWIFHYRWAKGKKSAGALPSGEQLAFVTVGGRTSCYCPALQKKGPSNVQTATKSSGKRQRDEPDIKQGDADETEEILPVQKKKRSSRAKPTVDGDVVSKEESGVAGAKDEGVPPTKSSGLKKTAKQVAKKEDVVPSKKKTATAKEKTTVKQEDTKDVELVGRRRSHRLTKS